MSSQLSIVNAALVDPRHWWRASNTLAKALAISVVVHLVLLMVRIAAPEVFEIKRPDAALDVVLVNSKSAQKPRNPTVLAQANLDAAAITTSSARPRRCPRRPCRRTATSCGRCSAASSSWKSSSNA